MPVKVCRAPAAMLVQHPEAVLGPITGEYRCTAPPLPPTGLRMDSNHDHAVALTWTASWTREVDYDIEAGTAHGSANLMTDHRARDTTYQSRDVKPGTYYVRVRGRNRCGAGAPSNEIVVTVR